MSTNFEVRVVPRSSQERIELQPDGTLKVWVRASPTDGQANEAVVALLAKRLGLTKSSMSILRGETGRRKTIGVEGIERSDALKRLSS